MDSQAKEKAFLNRLARVLEVAPESIDAPFVLDDRNWDSVAIISTIALIDDHFDTTVSGEGLQNCKSVGELLDLIRKSASQTRNDAKDPF
jgi:acyl carrier protein